MKSSLIYKNKSTSTSYTDKHGAAMHNTASEINLTNCTISTNTSTFYAPGLYNDGTTTGSLLNCLLHSNTSSAYDNNSIYGFALTYIYTSTESSGPRIDAGDPVTTTDQAGDTDYQGLPRIYNGVIDRGYVEDSPDTDGDGLKDSVEIAIGTSISETDTDADGMPDKWEYDNSLQPTTPDADADIDTDGLTNKEEYDLGTCPYLPDTDHDDMPDKWEHTHGLNPLVNDKWSDLDGDAAANYKEYIGNSSPSDPSDLPAPMLIYVKGSAPGNNTGLSWENAFFEVQSALNFAGPGDTIWVAKGVYSPTRSAGGSGTRFNTFQLKNNVAIIGGLSGSEAPGYDITQRDLIANETILSGTPTNSLHVIGHYNGTGLDKTAVLDGITISGGNANSSGDGAYGGGIYNNNASPTIRNCRITNNFGTNGGGMANLGNSAPSVTRTIFKENAATFGGGMVSLDNSAPSVINSIFESNASTSGGGLFAGNTASPRISNCSFISNTATSGASIYSEYGAAPTVRNTILWGSDNEVFNLDSGLDITWSDIQGGWPGEGNISTDPEFISAGPTPYELAGTDPQDKTSAPDVPVADAGPDQAVSPGALVSLNGLNSSVKNSTITRFLWACDDETPVILDGSDTPMCTFSADTDAPSSVTVFLTVTDAYGLKATDTVIINIADETMPPVAHAGGSQSVTTGEMAMLNGSGSEDPDGIIERYQWEQVSGSPVVLSASDTARPEFATTDLADQTLVFRLTVTDNDGLMASDLAIINISRDVSGEDIVPVADAGSSQTVDENQKVTLDASGSTDPSGKELKYHWVQISGPGVILSDIFDVSPTFMAPAIGADTSLRFKLTVTNSAGFSDSSTVTIQIRDVFHSPEPKGSLFSSTTNDLLTVIIAGGAAVTDWEPVNPETIPGSDDIAESFPYGLVDFKLKTMPGAVISMDIIFPEPFPDNTGWFKYDTENGWKDFSPSAVFSDDRKTVTLTLVDGGDGDDDGIANGVIIDPSGPARKKSPAPGVAPSGSGSGGSGCFIRSLFDEIK